MCYPACEPVRSGHRESALEVIHLCCLGDHLCTKVEEMLGLLIQALPTICSSLTIHGLHLLGNWGRGFTPYLIIVEEVLHHIL